MIPNNQKTSLLIASQLPAFVRDDPNYVNFVAFLEAYYEWMEQNGNVEDQVKNVTNNFDVDATSDEFINYFVNDFLPYWPEGSLLSKSRAVKFAKELYRTKGTPASYAFLFRILYDSEVEIFNTKDAVLQASAGKWYIAKSLKLASEDTNFLVTNNLRIFGETTKSIATIENSVVSGSKIEVFISNIERLFTSGEYVRVVDSNNQDVYFLNGSIVTPDSNGNYPAGAETLRAKIVGQISQVNVDSSNRGLLYQPGDPVVFHGGLNSNTGHGAAGTVATTTSGSIQRIYVVNGGYGYTSNPSTTINITNPSTSGANAIVGSLSPYNPPVYNIINAGKGYVVQDQVYVSNTAIGFVSGVSANGNILTLQYNVNINAYALLGQTATIVSANNLASNAYVKFSSTLGSAAANATFIPTDTISLKRFHQISNTNYNFSNIAISNANTSLVNAFTFTGFTTYPISSVVVINGGGGITTIPTVTASSTYVTDIGQDNLQNLGILAPLQIQNGGIGYRANDTINIIGGTGYGAYANVTTVDANGAITGVSYVYKTNKPAPLGGMGYTVSYLPGANVTSSNANAYGAIISVPGILGSGAEFSVIVDRVGSVSTINVSDYGEDYIAAPTVSLKIQDIVVNGLSLTNLPARGDQVYQGLNANNMTYFAYVDSVSVLQAYADPLQTLWNLRVYNYNAKPAYGQQLKIDRNEIAMNMSNQYSAIGSRYDSTGVIVYGDGTAKANASFLNGLVISQGQYLDTTGQPSSFDVLQSTNYNNYTYQLTVEKEIAKYRETLLNLLHPTGTNVIGRYAIKSNGTIETSSVNAFKQGHSLAYYTGNPGSYATMTADFNNKSNNIITFGGLSGANLEGIIVPGSIIQLTSPNGPNVYSNVVSVLDGNSNTVVIADSVWLTFGNVAFAQVNSGSNAINILSLTGSYDYINNGYYSNTSYPLMDIVYAGDTIKLAGNTATVKSVDYTNSIIYITTTFSAVSNSLLSVNRTLNTNNVHIFGYIGTQYIPEILTEDGNTLTTEDGNTIILLG